MYFSKVVTYLYISKPIEAVTCMCLHMSVCEPE